ncbi:hypothetical protein EXW72_05425 [Pseudomonas sp. BCA14]|nr:hypothetical protein EXW70_07060 [Pseudomonas sp. JMN1]TFF15053.1 hypothetical protein EXW71_01980 [Pseudomonas sp. BCA17]TFF31459.1 hypothetical protein EXW72_05425 [Pseudomonas sp. BCA14]TFF32413.1 hypothetical protein EXW73_01230 [Pseudomonas sp. BCA13]
MKNHQDNIRALPALLLTPAAVGKLKAAGDSTSFNATAEALIAHEKLRGTALADAALNAQERRLAQPILEYAQALTIDIYLHEGFLQTKDVRMKYFMDGFQLTFKIKAKVQATHIARTNHPQEIESYKTNIIGALQQNFIRASHFQRTETLKNVPHSDLYKRSFRAKHVLRVNSFIEQMFHFLNEASQLKAISNLLLQLVRIFALSFNSSLPSRDSASSQNSTYRPYSLHPARSIILDAEILQHHEQTPTQNAHSKKTPCHPDAGQPHLRRNSKPTHIAWPPAIKRDRACLFPRFSSTKEAM